MEIKELVGLWFIIIFSVIWFSYWGWWIWREARKQNKWIKEVNIARR